MKVTNTNAVEFEPTGRKYASDRQPEPAVKEPVTEPAADQKPEARDPEALKKVLSDSNISLNFHRDENTGRMVIEMIDNSTGDAVRQIPNEVSLRLSAMFSKVQGQLFEIEA